ncbi:MAG: tRNA lysidine(34) synthetase TilS [Kiritimatiellae bacterium]|nr:tRNA lysidine(34) synthetase TilS [Kiritimatiellia bacterium]
MFDVFFRFSFVMFLHSVIQTIRRHNLLSRRQHVLVGVSGGADSVALLAVLRDLAPAWKLRLTVAHLNHGIRGAAAAADAAFVADLARRWKLVFTGGRINVPVQARRQGISLEMAGRKARYAFFARAARTHHCDAIATAHTADDQAETVLLNLARGAGAAGLAGIPYIGWHGALKVVRPLRDVERKSIERFLARRRLAWREDATNADPAFLRNRVRHEVLPFLEERLNPEIRRALLRVSDILAGENEWLEFLADEIFKRCRVPGRGKLLNARPLAGFPLAARRRVLRRWLEACKLGAEALGFDSIARLDNLVSDRRGGRAVTLSGGWLVRRTGGVLTLSRRNNPSVRAFAVRLVVPGQTLLPGQDIRITASIGPGIVRERPASVGALPARASLSLRAWRKRRLLARSWKPGDRMRPLGMQGTKKLQDIFSDGKVPPGLRHGLPVIACGSEIVWIPGYRIAQGWEVRADESSALQLTVAP